jgi:hypothetical protein
MTHSVSTTIPADKRAVLIAGLRESAIIVEADGWSFGDELREAADMLEADARYRTYCSEYANVQANEALRYQKRIRDLEKQLEQGI